MAGMVDPEAVRDWLDSAAVDESVTALRPDYAVTLLVATGLTPGPTDEATEAVLADAESDARAVLAASGLDGIEHVVQWREAYRAFGSKPQRTRPSVEALLRRIPDAALPRIDRVTDLYNAVSVRHALPMGGEDLDAYRGPARLVRADGSEPFDTTAHGEPAVEHADVGEVVWRDDAGVTCRRWNWRQGVRTRITHDTTSAFFVVDALAAARPDGVGAGVAELRELIVHHHPGATVVERTVAAE